MKAGVKLEVQTGCRLHFGLMELCRHAPGCYAGIGLMLEQPSMIVRMEGISVDGGCRIDVPVSIWRKRIHNLVERRRRHSPNQLWPAQITLENPLPIHRGLGSGTQAACAVAGGLDLHDHLPRAGSAEDVAWRPFREACRADDDSAAELEIGRLAIISGRGLRSAIGLRGFLSGGFITDAGCQVLPSGWQAGVREAVSLESGRGYATNSLAFPQAWPVVLVFPRRAASVSGAVEQQLINALASQPNPQRSRMLSLAEQLAQGLKSNCSLSQFAVGLEEYMELAGGLFASVQGGQYSSPEIHEVVCRARDAGLLGVGQSSWGPTVFGFAESEVQACLAQRELTSSLQAMNYQVVISRADNTGARYRLCSTQLRTDLIR